MTWGFFPPKRTDWFNTQAHDKMILIGKFTVSAKTMAEKKKT